ncbi:MAG TPA: class I SAM-dependent methyltransferase [Acidimicrobiia bacterium]|nr:class I SAM-dependent methyltransferase [Acidimicrobiia bacterium]
MIRTGDAFGEALLSHLEREDRGWHVIERDDGYVEPAAADVYFGDLRSWSPTEHQAMEAITGSVLDVGAGAGRASLHLQDRGVDVTALDVSPGAIEVCRRRGIRQTFLGTVDEAAGGFDTFLFFGCNLGLIGSPEAAPRFFDAIGALSRPGARIIGTMLDPYQTTDPDHLAIHEENRRNGRMAGQVTIRIRRGLLATGWFDLLWLSTGELRDLAATVGWKVTESWEHGPLHTSVLERA